MAAHFRRAIPCDAPALLTVRAATRENPFSIEALAAIGGTAGSVAHDLEAGTLAGGLCEIQPATVVGFCLADIPAGELLQLRATHSTAGQLICSRQILRRVCATKEILVKKASQRRCNSC